MKRNQQRVAAQMTANSWNRFAWFGVVMATSAWMFYTGIFLIANREVFAGMFPLASALAVFGTGIVVWKRRARLSIYVGNIILLIAALVTMSIAIAFATWLASPELITKMNWPSHPIPVILGLDILLGAGILVNYSQCRKLLDGAPNTG